MKIITFYGIIYNMNMKFISMFKLVLSFRPEWKLKKTKIINSSHQWGEERWGEDFNYDN